MSSSLHPSVQLPHHPWTAYDVNERMSAAIRTPTRHTSHAAPSSRTSRASGRAIGSPLRRHDSPDIPIDPALLAEEEDAQGSTDDAEDEMMEEDEVLMSVVVSSQQRYLGSSVLRLISDALN